jgi:hypothetical protein
MDCHPERYQRLPELPPGRGWTATEVAEALVPRDERRGRYDVVRRRVQELEEPMRLLAVIGIRAGLSGRDNQVYGLHPSGLWNEALTAWEAGEAWVFRHPLARADDPATSKWAEERLRPDTDRHRIVKFFVQTRMY